MAAKKTKKKKTGIRAFLESYTGEEIPETVSQKRVQRRATAFLSLLGVDGRKEVKKKYRLTRKEMNLSYD
ncbi:MAG: hypothetical protein HYZ63_03275 [Candidatus Andersenbacteria bacterium]|nr:hypothetical protein [Candidatus Andersenbacteria bacterium]